MNKGINIKVINKYYQNKCALGMIILDDFYEIFEIPLDYWKIEQYESQWKEGLKRLNNYNNSCLVTAINNYKKRKYINWWLLYRENNMVYIQNHIVIGKLYEDLIGNNTFTLNTCYDFIPNRSIHNNEPEEAISEWCVKYNDFSKKID